MCIQWGGGKTKNIAATRLLLRHDARVNEKNIDDSTPLHLAVWIENIEIAQLLIIEIAQLLIANGADVNAEDKYMRTPLALTSKPELARIFIQNGAVLNAQRLKECYLFNSHRDCIVLLPLAVILSDLELVNDILEMNHQGVLQPIPPLKRHDGAVKKFIANDDRMIALHIAAAMGLNDIMDRLLEIPYVAALAQLDTEYRSGVPFDFIPRVVIPDEPVDANPIITPMRNRKRPIRDSEYNMLIEEGKRFVGELPAKRRKLN